MLEFSEQANQSVENYLNTIKKNKGRTLPLEAETILKACLPGMIETVFAASKGSMVNFSPMDTFRRMYVFANPEADNSEEYQRALLFNETETKLKSIMYKPNSYQRRGNTILERFIKTPMEWILDGVTSQEELDRLREKERHKPKPVVFFQYSATKYNRANGFQRY